MDNNPHTVAHIALVHLYILRMEIREHIVHLDDIDREIDRLYEDMVADRAARYMGNG